MRKLKRGRRLLAICCLGLLSAFACSCSRSAPVPLANGADKKQIVRQAHQSYYNLANAGLSEFRCQVLPDWDATFKTLKADPFGRDQVLPILRKTHFELLVGPDGASTVSHQSELVPPNEDVAERVRKATGGTEKVLTGFLQTWSGFMVKPTPLPDTESDYQFEDLGDKYRIKMKEASTDAVILMGRDFQIEEMTVVTPEFSGTVRPKFVRIKNQFILASYEGTYRAGSGNPQELSVQIEYGDVGGFSLPSKVTATVRLPSGAVAVPLTFANCQVKKR